MKFGDKVKVSAVLWRATENRINKRWRYTKTRPYKIWKSKNIEPREAIIIGFRTLGNGFKYYVDEVGWIFDREESVKAVLVVFNEKENPVFVLPDNITAP